MPRGIMIDLETLGSVPGCGIVSIGAAAFTNDGFVTDTLYLVVSRISCREHGLHEDEDTLRWWSKQSVEAQTILMLAEDPEDTCTLPDALQELNRFVMRQGGDVEVYGNGSDFDNAILAAAARAAGAKLAWPFWRNRCYRTLKERQPWVKLVREGTHHNALDDARSQARHLGRLNWAEALTTDKARDLMRFVGWMADHYRRRTSRRLLGLRLNTMPRRVALDLACATFDASALDAPFGHPDYVWDQNAASDLVDEDLRHWDS